MKHHFTLTKATPIGEIRSTLEEYSHPSGLKVVKLVNDDPQNVAAILFKTIPDSSDGVAHVLEHVVLCGSKKFAVKDPFFSMLRRGVAGFANAFTGSDFTCYPFAAHIPEDFFNLFDVYLDAAFHPIIDKASFLQEGIRLTSEGYKGIVLNEMKQAHSSLYDRFHHTTLGALFPDSPYRFDSGGVPKEIITLTHEKLVTFHKQCYHPSNAVLFLYGNLDTNAQLEMVETSIRSIPQQEKKIPFPPYQKPFSQKRVVHSHYPKTPQDTHTHLTIGFLLGDQKEPAKLLELQFIKMLLADHDGCPLQRTVMGEQLASSVEVLFDSDVLQPYVYFIFKEVPDAARLIERFDATLQECAREGFSPEAIEAALHQLKIAFLNTVEEGYPTGLQLFFRALLPTLNGADLKTMLGFQERIHQLEHAIKTPDFYKTAFNHFFLENSHRVEVHFTPNEELMEEERVRDPAVGPNEEKRIEEETKLVNDKRAETQDTSVLPLLDIQHIPKTLVHYPLKKLESPIETYLHTTWTNGLTYTDLFIDLPEMDNDELFYAGILTHLIGEIGTKEESFEEFIERKETVLSNWQIGIQILENRLALTASFDCLSENREKALAWVHDALLNTDFQEIDRIEEILKDLFARYKTSFTQRGVNRCILKTKALLHSGFAALEEIRGFSFYLRLKQLMTQPIGELIPTLKNLLPKLFQANGTCVLVAVSDQETFPTWNLETEKKLPIHTTNRLTADSAFFGFTAPLQAAENALSFPSFQYADPAAPLAKIVVQLVKHLQLHPILREQHGAYGTSMSIDLEQGIISMGTSCDPNIAHTYDVFKQVLLPIAEGKFTEEELYEAKLAALQKTETIVPINQRASHEYLLKRLHRTNEIRLNHRKRLIEADASAIKNCAAEILTQLKGEIRATIASKQGFTELVAGPGVLIEL